MCQSEVWSRRRLESIFHGIPQARMDATHFTIKTMKVTTKISRSLPGKKSSAVGLFGVYYPESQVFAPFRRRGKGESEEERVGGARGRTLNDLFGRESPGHLRLKDAEAGAVGPEGRDRSWQSIFSVGARRLGRESWRRWRCRRWGRRGDGGEEGSVPGFADRDGVPDASRLREPRRPLRDGGAPRDGACWCWGPPRRRFLGG